MTQIEQEPPTYNNLLDLTATPYPFKFQAFGKSIVIKVLQSPKSGVAYVLWDAEMILCAYLLMPANILRFKDAYCLEVGSGCSLAASLAWHLGALVVSTDLPEAVKGSVLPNISSVLNETNVPKNRKSQYVGMNLCWGCDEDAKTVDGVFQKLGATSTVVDNKKNSSNKKNSKQQSKAAKAAAQSHASASNSNNNNSDVVSKETTSTKAQEEEQEEELFVEIDTSNIQKISSRIDYILAADVIYHSDQHPILLRTLLTMMTAKTILIFVHRLRFNNDSNFVDACFKTFKLVKKTPVSEVMPKFPKNNVTVYEFVLKD